MIFSVTQTVWLTLRFNKMLPTVKGSALSIVSIIIVITAYITLNRTSEYADILIIILCWWGTAYASTKFSLSWLDIASYLIVVFLFTAALYLLSDDLSIYKDFSGFSTLDKFCIAAAHACILCSAVLFDILVNYVISLWKRH